MTGSVPVDIIYCRMGKPIDHGGQWRSGAVIIERLAGRTYLVGTSTNMLEL